MRVASAAAAVEESDPGVRGCGSIWLPTLGAWRIGTTERIQGDVGASSAGHSAGTVVAGIHDELAFDRSREAHSDQGCNIGGLHRNGFELS